jgi:hypothetical protein
MPFTLTTFQPAGGQAKAGGGAMTVPGAPQIFTYRTADDAAAVDTTGYFNAVRGLLEVGDLIWRITVDGAGAVTSAGWHMVRTKTATAVDTTDANAFTTTNTD